MVEPRPVITARNSVRHATPQRLPPMTQSRLQIAGSCMLRMKPSGLKEPSKSCTEPANIEPMG